MKRALLAGLVVLAGCGSWRHVKHEVRVLPDGTKLYCSWTENGHSGNSSDPQCVVLP